MIDKTSLLSVAPKWKTVALLHFFSVGDPVGNGLDPIFDEIAGGFAEGKALSEILDRHEIQVRNVYSHERREDLVEKTMDLALVMEQNDSRHSPITGRLLSLVHRLDEMLRDVYAENVSHDDERIGVLLEKSREVWIAASAEGVNGVPEEFADVPVPGERGG